MPSFLAYRLGLMFHLGSTFSKNDGRHFGPKIWFGCASRARNPKGPKIGPFCHQLGRHPTVLRDIATKFAQNFGADLAR